MATSDTSTMGPIEVKDEAFWNVSAAQRATLLKIWIQLRGSQASIQMYDNVCVEAEYQCTDSAQEMMLVRNLKTKLGSYPEALLRMSDIQYVEFPEFSVSTAQRENTTVVITPPSSSSV